MARTISGRVTKGPTPIILIMFSEIAPRSPIPRTSPSSLAILDFSRCGTRSRFSISPYHKTSSGFGISPDHETTGAPHLARFLRDVGIPRTLTFFANRLKNLPVNRRRLPHLAKNERDTRISCALLHPGPRVRLSSMKAA